MDFFSFDRTTYPSQVLVRSLFLIFADFSFAEPVPSWQAVGKVDAPPPNRANFYKG